ncbi:MAG TPA: serine/threonine-protein kinase [Gemmatimonadales bacterium]|nr:serine/threonine-protein kinase [Gemmatimonadales bacterium]
MTEPAQPAAPAGTIDRLRQALGGKYDVRRLMGRGGFAEVFEVWDRDLERRLAVKVLRPDIAWTSGMLQRFKQETRTIARLQHPHILPIHFVGEGQGLVYYAMPLVEGESLGDLLRRSGPLPPDRALAIAIPIVQALAHAHEQGLIHRDIKPDNVMIEASSGRPLLVDFGIAKRLDADGGLTQTGFVVGTPHYMSPEQALGQGDVDARSDLYAMGAVLFQMLTGAPPFEGESSQEIVGKHLAEPPPVPADVDRRIPRWLSNVITRALQKRPAERFQSAAMMLEALSQERPAASPAPVPVSADSATELVPSQERPSAAPRAPTGGPAGRRTGGPSRRWVYPLVLLTVVGAVGFWLVTRPQLEFQNRLIHPVRVTIAGEERVVEPGDRATLPLPRDHGAAIAWSLVRPANSRGEPLGVEVSGTINVTRRRGRSRAAADAGASEGAYFAPLVTNETGRPLTAVVNAGLQGALSCGCTIPPGATRVPIGYYPLHQNSTVQVRDGQGRTATFRNLGPEVNRRTGVVRLRFVEGDLR